MAGPAICLTHPQYAISKPSTAKYDVRARLTFGAAPTCAGITRWIDNNISAHRLEPVESVHSDAPECIDRDLSLHFDLELGPQQSGARACIVNVRNERDFVLCAIKRG